MSDSNGAPYWSSSPSARVSDVVVQSVGIEDCTSRLSRVRTSCFARRRGMLCGAEHPGQRQHDAQACRACWVHAIHFQQATGRPDLTRGAPQPRASALRPLVPCFAHLTTSMIIPDLGFVGTGMIAQIHSSGHAGRSVAPLVAVGAGSEVPI
jgi:hypothetical protein